MDKKVVVNSVLTEEMMDAGRDLTERLDKAEVDIKAALWFYISDSNRWRLIFASPEVGELGPLKVYKKVQSSIAKTPEDKPKIALSDISVVDNKDPLISTLRIMLKTGKGISGIRLSRNAINGHFIEDAYVYRL